MESQIIQFAWDNFISEGILVIAAVFILGQLIKLLPLFDRIPNRYISVIGVVVGAAIAILCPDVYPEANYVTAGIKGGCLGLMTTGLYEVLKLFFPALTAKIEEKTSTLDTTLADVVDAASEAGKTDVSNAQENPRTLEQLIEELEIAIDNSALAEDIDRLTVALEEAKAKLESKQQIQEEQEEVLEEE